MAQFSLNELKEKFSSLDQSVLVSDQTLDVPYVTPLWNEYLKVNELTFSQANVSTESNFLSISGKVELNNGIKVNGLIVIFEAQNRILSTVELGYVLVLEHVSTSGFHEPRIEHLLINNKSYGLVLTNADKSIKELNLNVDFLIPAYLVSSIGNGLNVSGEFNLPEIPVLIDSHQFDNAHMVLMGYDSGGDYAEFSFSTKIEQSIKIGSVRINISNLTAKQYKSKDAAAIEEYFFNCLGQVSVGNLELPISFEYNTRSETARIKSPDINVSLTDIGELSSLFGKENPVKQLPAPAGILENIALTNFELEYSLEQKKITSTYVQLTSEGSWSIIPGIFEISNLELIWIIRDPFSTTRQTNFQMSGMMDVADTGIYMQAQFPDFVVFGDLQPGSSIDLATVVEKVGFDLFELPMELRVMDIEVTARPRDRAFDLEMLISSDWQLFTLGEGENEKHYSLKEISIDLSYDNQKFEGTVAGILDFAGWDTQIVAYIEDPLRIEGVIPYLNFTDFLEEFPLVPVDNLPDFAFRDIEFSITPKTREFSLSGVSADSWDLELGFLPKLSIQEVGIELDRTLLDSGSYDLDYAFFGSIVLAEKYTLTVRIDKNKVGDQEGWLINGSFRASEPLNFIALINELIPGESLDLPDDVINVDVNSVEVSIDTINKVYSLQVATYMGIDLGEIGQVTATSFAFEYEKIASDSSWSIEGKGEIELGDFVTLPTVVEIEKVAESTA